MQNIPLAFFSVVLFVLLVLRRSVKSDVPWTSPDGSRVVIDLALVQGWQVLVVNDDVVT